MRSNCLRLIASSVLVVMAALVGLVPTARAEEDMCTREREPTIGDLSVLIDYMIYSSGSLSPNYEYDFATDGIMDWEDLDKILCRIIPVPDPCAFVITLPFTTICEPLPIWSLDLAKTRGEASVAYLGGVVQVSGISSSGDDGVRIWPNMDEDWAPTLRVELENVELGGDLSESVALRFTGVREPYDISGVKRGFDMEWLAWAEAGHDGGMINLTLGLGELTLPTLELEASADESRTASIMVGASELSLTGDPVNGLPSISALSLVYSTTTTFIIEFDRAIEFTTVDESPVITFLADRLVLSSENTLQPAHGLGPFEITATDLGWFSVSLEEIELPCVGRVGDVNGLGGDEPTIADIAAMIDFLFISNSPDAIACLAEADVNQSGGSDVTRSDITISDVAILIDYLFISGVYHPDTNPDGVNLNECL